MFVIIRRVIGFSLIALAVAILAFDLLQMAGKGVAFSAHSISQDWQLYGSASYARFKTWLAHAMPAKVAGYTEIALSLWTWTAIALAGVLIAPQRRAD